MGTSEESIIYIFVPLIGGIIGGIIGSLVTVVWFKARVKIWMNDKRIKKALFGFLEVQEYASLVRDSFLKINQHKEDIQNTLKNAIGKDEKEVIGLIHDSYKNLEGTMNIYLARQKELERKIFGNMEI